jgi:RND family efflux transporter MFP subunit
MTTSLVSKTAAANGAAERLSVRLPLPRLFRDAPTYVLLALTAVAAAFVTACSTPAAQSAAPPPPRVTAAHAIARDVTEWSEFTGRLEAVHHVDVRPRVSGLIASVHFTEGAIVRRGDLLFQIDPRPFQAEVDRLGAELTRARATMTRSTSERERADRLAAANAMSAEERDRRSASAEEAAAQVAAVQAALRAAELNLEFTRVVAPIDGRASHAIVTEGNLVTGGPGEATLLTTLVSLDPIYASFEADEQSFLAFSSAARAGAAGSPRTSIRMALAGDEGFSRQGRLDFLDNQLDPSTGTIRVRAVFANADRALTPGLFVRLRMSGSHAARSVLVRDDAVGTDLDKRFVYLVTPAQTIAYRSVTLGPLVDGLRVVRSGLVPDDVVVVNGLQRVRPGVKVTPDVQPMERVR